MAAGSLQYAFGSASAVDPSSENEPDPRPSPKTHFERGDPASGRASWQWPFDSQENQQIGLGAAVGGGSVPTRQAATTIWGPATLPEWVEAEPGDKIGPTFEPMTAGAQACHQTISNVDPGRDAHAIAGFDRAASGKKPIDSQLALKWLRSVLGVSRRRAPDCSPERENDGNKSRPEHGRLCQAPSASDHARARSYSRQWTQPRLPRWSEPECSSAPA
jgi:hypothetical protein